MAKKNPDASWRQVAANMPVLYRTLPGEEYDIKNDQVAKWISNSPRIMSVFIAQLRNDGLIVYNKETGTWRGRDHLL